MNRFKSLACCAIAAVAALGMQAQATTVKVGQSTAPWLGFMNVSNLPAPDGDGAYQFGSGWAVPDLPVSFDDANSKLTFFPNSINDPNEYWYQCTGSGSAPNCGSPGALGNKIMEANMYIEETDVLNGQTVTFEYNILANTFTSAHTAIAFIRDFAPDYSSSNDVYSAPLTPGASSISLATDAAAGRHVQYGFQVKGVNVWITDIAPFGNLMVGTVPEPASLSLVGMCGLAFVGMRRRNRKLV
ncbi:PEP-CTERM sorting domain-containing protein [Bythopirellula goksoeyrii]|uniref:Ice-binding protein C-terminal domain-containing protein n=1 Tax=Bythopirellula goksoeyrii TaxID=1400387 RepID=A0A5B9QQM1_9BACT|nr:PEP-CTERM sorting domain-containing protein [Bythopirellula goksoeyrii]QEG36421.1 hypothetical protein Pr1d_37350 [Bythopirellula goksoeyrii]